MTENEIPETHTPENEKIMDEEGKQWCHHAEAGSGPHGKFYGHGPASMKSKDHSQRFRPDACEQGYSKSGGYGHWPQMPSMGSMPMMGMMPVMFIPVIPVMMPPMGFMPMGCGMPPMGSMPMGYGMPSTCGPQQDDWHQWSKGKGHKKGHHPKGYDSGKHGVWS